MTTLQANHSGKAKAANVVVAPPPEAAIGHQLARVLYIASMLLLLIGMWILIDPYERRTGTKLHVYITLFAFEAYMWLLLGLARWQRRAGLQRDTANSAFYTLLLTGFLFIALDELYLIAAGEAYFATMVAVGLSVTRLLAARRWLGIHLPRAPLAYCMGWLVLIAGAAPAFHLLVDNKEAQISLACGLCWIVALYAVAHLALVTKERSKHRPSKAQPLAAWTTPWSLLTVAALMAALQLRAAMYGVFVDPAWWYFSPMILGGTLVGVALAHATGQGQPYAWVAFVTAAAYCLAATGDHVHPPLPDIWQSLPANLLAEPFYSPAGFALLMLVAIGILLKQIGFVLLAVALPLGFGFVMAAKAISTRTYGKGLSVLAGAFALLGAGGALQWYQHRRQERRLSGPAPLENSTVNVTPADTGNKETQ